MRRRQTSSTIAVLAGLLILLVFVVIGCCACWSVLDRLVPSGEETPTPVRSQATLRLAYSPEKEPLISELVTGFNALGLTTPDGQPMTVETVQLEPDAMIQGALTGDFQAMTPDSSIWLDQLDRAWQEQTGSESPLVGQTVRYAVSPIVIAMWADVAQSMGYPAQSVGWLDLLARAQRDPDFGWSHPSTTTASGLLATLAEFYAGAGKTRGLTEEDVQRQTTLDYVAAIEKTVRHYGEGEWALVQRLLSEGRGDLDAFVCQEQLVIYYNQQAGSSARPALVAVYPKEGSLWEDHPLALLETPDLTANQRLVFSRFVEYLQSPETQARVLAHGYRPTDLSISLSGPDSPFTSDLGVDPTQPQTALQVPNPAVVQVVQDVWWYTKRHTNVYLVVDTSGSMEGEKLESAQEALRIFVEQIKGDQERVGLIEFASDVYDVVEMDELSRNREKLMAGIDGLWAGGDTSLLDGVKVAYDRLQERGDTERINAIVVMTDGLENDSVISLYELISRVKEGNAGGVRVVVFCIAYGDDADLNTLQAIAEASGGDVRRGDPETIRQLYKILSTYF